MYELYDENDLHTELASALKKEYKVKLNETETTNKSFKQKQIEAQLAYVAATAKKENGEGAYLDKLTETAKEYNVDMKPVQESKPVTEVKSVADWNKVIAAPAANNNTEPVVERQDNNSGWITLAVIALVAEIILFATGHVGLGLVAGFVFVTIKQNVFHIKPSPLGSAIITGAICKTAIGSSRKSRSHYNHVRSGYRRRRHSGRG